MITKLVVTWLDGTVLTYSNVSDPYVSPGYTSLSFLDADGSRVLIPLSSVRLYRHYEAPVPAAPMEDPAPAFTSENIGDINIDDYIEDVRAFGGEPAVEKLKAAYAAAKINPDLYSKATPDES